MWEVKDLVALVVEENDDELQKTCKELSDLGLKTIICVHEYSEAIAIINNDMSVDIVIADINLDRIQSAGAFLCKAAKRERPGLLFLVSSRTSGVSFMCESFSAGADGIINKEYEDDIAGVVPKWLSLAAKRRNVEDILKKM